MASPLLTPTDRARPAQDSAYPACHTKVWRASLSGQAGHCHRDNDLARPPRKD
jgi:hypothetical protein